MTDTTEMQKALAAAQPTAEEVATRVYLEAMTAAGWLIERLVIDDAVSIPVKSHRELESVDSIMGRLKLSASFYICKGSSDMFISGAL